MSIGRTTLPPISFGSGSGGVAPGTISLPGIETRLIHVDKGDNVLMDGTRQRPYHTVAAGIAAAVALVPTATSRAAVLIYPGEYNESGLTSGDYVDLVGIGTRGSVRIEGAAGVVLTVTHGTFRAWNITFAQTSANGIVTVTGVFAAFAEFHECSFEGIADNASRVYVTGSSWARFEDCTFTSAGGAANRVFYSDTAGTIADCRRCRLSGCMVHTSSSYYVDSCVIEGNINSITDAACSVTNSVMIPVSFCIYFHATPSSCVIMNNRFVAAVGNLDIESGAARTGFIIRGNVMTRGINGYISHIDPVRNVGAAGMLDWYPTVQAALDSCTFDDIVVKLMVDVTLAASLTAPAGRILTIDGNGMHAISYNGNHMFLNQAGTTLTLRDVLITGGVNARFSLSNVTSTIIIEDATIEAYIYNYGGTIYSRRSRHIGQASGPGALILISDAAIVRFEHSYVKGAAGAFAVYWSASSCLNLYAKYSKFYHGSGAANDPFGRDGVQVPTWHSHHNQFNSIPGSGWLTNLIPPAQTMDSVDPGADY